VSNYKANYVVQSSPALILFMIKPELPSHCSVRLLSILTGKGMSGLEERSLSHMQVLFLPLAMVVLWDYNLQLFIEKRSSTHKKGH
jgi:hypothetical protein